MTEKQLRERVRVEWIGYGTYRVTITYRGKEYACKSHNSLAYDMRNWEQGEPRAWYASARQALEAFYDECKRANMLGEYNT